MTKTDIFVDWKSAGLQPFFPDHLMTGINVPSTPQPSPQHILLGLLLEAIAISLID